MFSARRVPALVVSFAVHLAVFAALVFLMRREAHAPVPSAHATDELAIVARRFSPATA